MLLLLWLVHSWLSVSTAVVVDTKYGAVEGTTLTLQDPYHFGFEVDSFLGIPFAKPPVGDLRFTNPQEPDSWDDVFVADHLRTVCTQNANSTLMLTHPGWTDIEEDCLNLNIYTPSDKSNGPYAVYVWMYGGGFSSGANIAYPGYFIAAHDVIFVVPNYRLSIFGFSYTGDDIVPGNMGLRDQALALQFVQENIAAFGGDPDRVTIGGQSAGGASVGFHMISPETEGLFHGAIPMSGTELALWAYFSDLHDNLGYLQQVAEAVECPVTDTQEMVDCLRTIDDEELNNVNFICDVYDRPCDGFRPSVDGPGGFIPDVPWKMRAEGAGHVVPEMVGLCTMDSAFFLPFLEPLSRLQFENRVSLKAETYSSIFRDNRSEEDVAQAINFNYSPWPHIYDGEQNRHAYAMLETDTTFGVPADAHAKWQSDLAPVYYYMFDYVSDNTNMDDWMEAWHILDIPYVFGLYFFPYNPEAHEQSEFSDIFMISAIEEDEQYSYYMLELWTNFIKYGNPTPDPPPQPPAFLDQDPVVWTTFGKDNYTSLRLGGEEITLGQDYRQHEYAFWEYYMTWMAFGDDRHPEYT